MKSRFAILASLGSALLTGLPAGAQTIPSFSGPTLANDTLRLPPPAPGSRTILVLGFSKKSGDACKPWFEGITAQLKTKPQIGYYEMPVLAGAPGFVRGMIVHNMRSTLTPDQQKHFAPIMENAQAWKDAVHFSAPDDAYVVIIDEHGNILWHDSGPWSPDKERTLQQAISKL
ncbi:hypothetical protein H7849_20995 [Alloacidobacterium dinghuense]|uniref:Uncharacterized protein n=1 Tax=Alloacidobacterium dinghuense TaxID=2763107 RepID=A0A7G8BG56_9BACT|nr:hypothetical protein [Alloacidobacterium dinghuense]QNI31526.1 hypothetical protein H7849_20995 [Alloacidobacterium dinghuense]